MDIDIVQAKVRGKHLHRICAGHAEHAAVRGYAADALQPGFLNVDVQRPMLRRVIHDRDRNRRPRRDLHAGGIHLGVRAERVDIRDIERRIAVSVAGHGEPKVRAHTRNITGVRRGAERAEQQRCHKQEQKRQSQSLLQFRCRIHRVLHSPAPEPAAGCDDPCASDGVSAPHRSR